MIHGNVGRFGAIRALVLVASFAIGLVASTAVPALAQTSGTWTNTGTLNTPRGAYTATLLQDGQYWFRVARTLPDTSSRAPSYTIPPPANGP